MYPRKGQIDKARFQKAMEAKAFFLRFLNADCDRVAIENPRPLKIVELPKEDQRIQPYQFGDPWSKLTYLWLKIFRRWFTPMFLQNGSPLFLPEQAARRGGQLRSKDTSQFQSPFKNIPRYCGRYGATMGRSIRR